MDNMRSLLLLFGLSVCCFGYAQSLNCTALGEQLCTQDGACAAFGIYGDEIQLHGCVALVANLDWTITVRNTTSGGYDTLSGTQNIDETQCTVHPNTGMSHQCAPPPPPPQPPLYTKQGSIDVGTFENTIFYWKGKLYNVENIPCSYWEHAGVWDPAWGNHSYARIREFESGIIVSNISSSLGFGFISAFPDYETGIVWLFGTPSDRCLGNGNAKTVQSWWSTDLVTWDTALAFNYGIHTYNIEVTRVGPLGGATAEERAAWDQRQRSAAQTSGLPPHRYAMFLECFAWAINNNADGNLTYGWELLPNTTAPHGAPCGGPSMAYNPADLHYYILTGGRQVYLYRTLDFRVWEESNPSPFIVPSEEDAGVAPYSDFAGRIRTLGLGSPPNKYVGVPEPFPHRPYVPYWTGTNWSAWVANSNDADICCMHADVTEAYVIWGASTQGRPPKSPLTGTDAGTNAVGVAPMPLTTMLTRYFP